MYGFYTGWICEETHWNQVKFKNRINQGHTKLAAAKTLYTACCANSKSIKNYLQKFAGSSERRKRVDWKFYL